MATNNKLTVNDFDTNEPLKVSLGIIDMGSIINMANENDLSEIVPLGTIALSPAECSSFIGWLRGSKKWRGTANKAVDSRLCSGSEIGALFGYRTFVRMLSMHGYPCDDKAVESVIKILNWKNSFMPAKQMSPAARNAQLEQSGKTYVFTILGSRLNACPNDL